MWVTLCKRGGKTSKGEAPQETCIQEGERGLPTSFNGSLTRCRGGVQRLRKLGGSLGLKLKGYGRECVEVEIPSQAHHKSL